MKAARLLPLLLLLAGAWLSGCAEKEPEPMRPAGPELVLVFRHGRVSGFETFFRQIIERFERDNPGIRVVDENMPWDSGQQHQLYAINLEGRSASFDLMGLDIVWIAEFARAGWLADLGPWFDAGERRRFLPGTIQAASFSGGVFAVPWFTDAGLLYYRKDLLAKHGHRAPETWEELARAARDVVRREGDPNLAGFVWQGKQYEGLVCNAMEYLSSNGVRVVDEAGRWAVDEARAEEAMSAMAGLLRGDKVSPELVLAADEETTRHIFGDGHAVFLRNWPYALGIFNKPGSAVHGKVGIAPLPHFPGYPSAGTLGGWFLGVNRFSKNPQAAYRLAAYLASPEVQRLVYDRIGYLPTRAELYRDVGLLKDHPELREFERILAGARPRPVTPHYMSVSDVLQNELSAVLSELKTPRQAVRDMRVQLEPVLSAGAEGGPRP